MLARFGRGSGNLMARWGRRAHGEQGQVLVLGALFMTVLLGASGVAIDAGLATIERRAAQTAADAAALAGAQDLSGAAATPTSAQQTQAAADAGSLASANGYPNGGAVTVTIHTPVSNANVNGNANCKSQSHANDVHSVEVCIEKDVSTLLLGVLGMSSIKITAYAVATGYGSYITNPTIALLNPHLPESLDVGITGAAGSPINIQVDGPLVVNSDDSHEAEQTHNNYFFNSPSNIVGGRIDQLGNGTIGPSSQHLPSPIPDPLAAVSTPTLANAPQSATPGFGWKCPHGHTPTLPNLCDGALGGGGQGCETLGPPPDCTVHHYNEVVQPGVYHNLQVDDDGSITLLPGVYIITGYLQLIDGPTAPGNITGTGVTLYFACPSATAPYWQACAPGTSNQNGSGPGGYLNLTGANVSTTHGWSPESNPHTLHAHYNLSAPTSGYYQGMLIFYDRQNYNPNFGSTEDHPTGIEIEGDNTDTLSGTIYAQHTRGIFFTQTANTTWTINSCFVMDTLEMDGIGNYHITCGQSGNYYSSAGAGSATLAE